MGRNNLHRDNSLSSPIETVTGTDFGSVNSDILIYLSLQLMKDSENRYLPDFFSFFILCMLGNFSCFYFVVC